MKHRTAWIVSIVAFAGAVGVDLAIDTSYPPGYSAMIGFAGCAAIVIVSKWLGKRFIQRDEDHWPNDIPADIEEDLRG